MASDRGLYSNPLFLTDSYKVTHHKMMPPEVTRVYDHLEPRVGGEFKEVGFFGLQYALYRYLAGRVLSHKKSRRAEGFFGEHFRNSSYYNKAGVEHIIDDHGGRLPILIKALPEGLVVPEGNVQLTIENTCPRCAWLPEYLDPLLTQQWMGSTVQTVSLEMKKIIWAALKKSGTATTDNLQFKLHDFGFRGSTCPEHAAIAGAAHLSNFAGSDNLIAIEMLRLFYHADEMPGFSVAASEHGVTTMWGEDHEEDFVRHCLKEFPDGILALVSDSWDLMNMIGKIFGSTFRDAIIARNGVLVMRPDSGVAEQILPVALETNGRNFGFTENSKGYRVPHKNIALLQGDGIKRHTLGPILDAVMDARWSADGLNYGSGGGLVADVARDTQRYAAKVSYIEIDNGRIKRDVQKKPKTDLTKASKKGMFKVVDCDGVIKTVSHDALGVDLLQTKFRNGRVVLEERLSNIRARMSRGFVNE